MVLGTLLDTLSDVGAIGGILSIVGVGLLILLLASQSRQIQAMREWIEAEPDRQKAAQQETIAEVQRRIAQARERRSAQAGAKPGTPTKPGVPGARPPGSPAVPAAAGVAAGAAAGAVAAKPGDPIIPAKPADPAKPGLAPALGADGLPKPAFAPLTPAGGGSVPPPADGGDDDEDALIGSAEDPGQETQLADAIPASSGRDTIYDDGDFDLVDDEPSSGGNRLLFGAGIAVLIAGVVLLGTLLFGGGDEDPATSGDNSAQSDPAAGGGDEDPKPSTPSSESEVDPSSVTVRVLNGTTVTGLAQRVTENLTTKGYGSVAPDTYSSSQSLSESTIAYTDGFKAAATQIADDLGLPSSSVQAMDAEIRVAATEQADVAVLVGTDLDNGASPTTG